MKSIDENFRVTKLRTKYQPDAEGIVRKHVDIRNNVETLAFTNIANRPHDKPDCETAKDTLISLYSKENNKLTMSEGGGRLENADKADMTTETLRTPPIYQKTV